MYVANERIRFRSKSFQMAIMHNIAKLSKAKDMELDLVLIAEKAPPACRIIT